VTAYLSRARPPDLLRVTRRSEPIFNVPAVVVAVIAACVFVHLARVYVLGINSDEDIEFQATFAFIPARYGSNPLLDGELPGGWGADIWTFVTYAFLHGNWTHLIVNSVWLLPFGSALARRIGPVRFLLFFAVTAAAGAALHLATNWGAVQVVIGASGAISGYMAASVRFAFQRGGPLDLLRSGDEAAYRLPSVPLAALVRDRRIVAFIVAWLGVNLAVGLGALVLPGVDQAVAWQAHIGGFLAGLFLFDLFDRVDAPQPESQGEPTESGSGGENLSPPQ
jgi:membrane associated rhomboid family serine protease